MAEDKRISKILIVGHHTLLSLQEKVNIVAEISEKTGIDGEEISFADEDLEQIIKERREAEESLKLKAYEIEDLYLSYHEPIIEQELPQFNQVPLKINKPQRKVVNRRFYRPQNRR